MSDLGVVDAWKVLEVTSGIVEQEVIHGELRCAVQVREAGSCEDGCVFGSPRCAPGRRGFHGHWARRLSFDVAVAGRGAVSCELLTPQCHTAAHTDRMLGLWAPLGGLYLHHVSPPDYLADVAGSSCPLVGGVCWSDVTFMQADRCVERLLAGGVPAVWAWLGEEWLPQAMGVER